MKKSAIAVLVAALWGLTACSGGAEAPEQPEEEVTVSTPPDTPTASASPTKEPADDFDTAVKFTKLAHTDEYAAAAKLAKPESPAARYLAHQTLTRKAQTIAGLPEEGNFPTVKADPKTQSVKISYPKEEPVEGERTPKALTYTWKDFTSEQGKVTGWTGATGPVKDVLWTRQTTAESEGRKAVLKSAYLANSKSVWITVELSSRVATGFTFAEYAAKNGYRQGMVEEYASELSKGEKTLAYFVVKDAKFGGTLHIPYTDAEGFDEGELLLTIK